MSRLFGFCLCLCLVSLASGQSSSDERPGKLQPGDPSAVDEMTTDDDAPRSTGLVPSQPSSDESRDVEEDHAIARLLTSQDREDHPRTLRPVQPSTMHAPSMAQQHAHDHIIYDPGEGGQGLLDDVGILGMSPLAEKLDAIDLPLRRMESAFVPGIDMGLIGGDSRKDDSAHMAESAIRPQDPLLHAVLNDPVLIGAQPRIDSMVVEPDKTDAPLRFSDVDSAMGASLAAIGDYPGAERLLATAVRRNMKDHGVLHPRTQAAVRVLVEFYQSWAATEPEKSDEADRYRKLLAR